LSFGVGKIERPTMNRSISTPWNVVARHLFTTWSVPLEKNRDYP
jgi:hypothetical protein